jgi:hypothetical protein
MATEPSVEVTMIPSDIQSIGFSDPTRAMPRDGEFVSAAISGFSTHTFEFSEPGGPGHLAPGRLLERTRPL